MMVDPAAVLARFYPPAWLTPALLWRHGRQAAQKALAVADRLAQLNPDRCFLFFSKDGRTAEQGRSAAQVAALPAAYGPDQAVRFQRLTERFEAPDAP
ncbi:MAG: hypothetical protein JRJ72_10160 [Deltaproteobacteria bacterium]|nr:hypothetical protein [Deltaproteobacteria bacterium]